MRTRNRELITILGPTATGKTRLAAALARRIDGEIISADSRQVYRGMDIGTGKDIDEYGSGESLVPYHLIDILEPGEEFNLFDFQRCFVKGCKEIFERGKTAILCGGTGLYIDSVLSRYVLADVPQDPALRNELDSLGDSELLSRLSASRNLHNTTDSLDRERMIRAIEIAENAKPDEKSIVPELNQFNFGLRTPRPILKKRIDARLKDRLENGLIEEVEQLLEVCTAEQLTFYGLEYRLVTAYVLGRINRNDMYQKLKSEIYQFAKRQEKWFRKMERNGVKIIWFDAEDDLESMVSRILDTTGRQICS